MSWIYKIPNFKAWCVDKKGWYREKCEGKYPIKQIDNTEKMYFREWTARWKYKSPTYIKYCIDYYHFDRLDMEASGLVTNADLNETEDYQYGQYMDDMINEMAAYYINLEINYTNDSIREGIEYAETYKYYWDKNDTMNMNETKKQACSKYLKNGKKESDFAIYWTLGRFLFSKYNILLDVLFEEDK